MLYIAHRGDHHEHEENSYEAIIKAISDPFWDGVEFDVRFTKDFKCVIFHDDNTKRLCGLDKKINEMSLEELHTLRFIRYHNDTIPTLKNMLEAIQTTQKKILIEIKDQLNPIQKDSIINILHSFQHLDIEIISFHVNNKLEAYPFCFLSSKLTEKDLITLSQKHVHHVNIDYQNHSLLDIKDLISKGFNVSIWTNDLDDNPYKYMQIQYFTSNKIKRSAL